MGERQWYYIQAGNQTGPVSEAELKGLLQSGKLARETIVWSDALSGWTPAVQVELLGMSAGEPQWHYLQGSAQTGPVAQSELKQLITAGRVPAQAMVWTQGMESWAPAGTVAALSAPAGQAAAAAQPAQTPLAAAGGLLTPSEVVLLFADQFAGEGSLLKGGNWTTLTTGAKVGYTDLTAALLSAALLANEQAGAIRLRMAPKKAMFGLKTVNAIYVEYVQDPPEWPEGSLEWIAVEGMRGMQPREAADLFTGMLLMDSSYPHTLAANIASVGLEKRALLSTEEKKKLLIISTMNFRVTDQTRQAMEACPSGPVRQLLDQCRQTRPDIYQGLVEAAAKAIGNRKEYSDD
ncbi:MAG TPA: DUF4339 domain-containing protein [Symbiobacteriaceae bacterium]|nr:DUF4339 domain-containing protein [Symbiobacteriaceae bacterium]